MRRQKREPEGAATKEERSERSDMTGLKDGARGQTKQCRQSVVAEKGRKGILFWSLQKGMQPCQHLNFSLVRPNFDF
jgi:hypothetical protein